MKHDTITTPWNWSLQRQVASIADASLVALYLLLADILIISLPDGSVLKALLSGPLLLFLPGYAVVAALYPRRSTAAGVGWIERGVLSVAISLGILSVLGVVFALVGFDLTAAWLRLAALEGIIVVGLSIGLVRRFRRAPDERFRLPYREVTSRLGGALWTAPSRTDRLLNLALIALVLVSVFGLAFAIVSPTGAEQYTTMSLVTENDAGEYVADGYPTDLSQGEEASLVVGLENQEGADRQYTVVPVLQRLDTSEESATVLERQQLDPIRVELSDGETRYESHTFAPQLTGTELRLVYLLYVGDPPQNPTVDSAYRHTAIWVTVSDT